MPTLESPATQGAKLLSIAPATVLVGPDVRAQLAGLLAGYGQQVLVVTGPHTWARVEATLAPLLGRAGLGFAVHAYDPDCTEASALAAEALASTRGAEVVLGVGGGKALDLAKLAGDRAGLPVVTFPTSAATCAAWTALGNFYQPSGAFDFGRALPRGPVAVVVDTQLIARAPARLLASGLADTLAKWIETSASVSYPTAEMTTRAAWTMARLLHDEIREWGAEAYRDALAGRHSALVDRAIEANICLAGTVGGLGGERCRSVAAHAVCNALTTMPGNAQSWHGEKVAFGIVTQLLLASREADARSFARFFQSIDVPTTLAGLGYTLDDAQLRAVAEHVCRPASTVHHLPFSVTPEHVREALLAADAIGRAIA